MTRQNSLTRIKKLLKDLRNDTSTVSYGLKLSVELILYDLLTDLHLKQAKLALVRPDPYQQLIEGQSFHYTAHSGRKGTRIVKYCPVMEKCETSPRSKIILQTSVQSGNDWPQTTQIDTAPDRRLLP